MCKCGFVGLVTILPYSMGLDRRTDDESTRNNHRTQQSNPVFLLTSQHEPVLLRLNVKITLSVIAVIEQPAYSSGQFALRKRNPNKSCFNKKRCNKA